MNFQTYLGCFMIAHLTHCLGIEGGFCSIVCIYLDGTLQETYI